jgi:hypothetical protein
MIDRDIKQNGASDTPYRFSNKINIKGHAKPSSFTNYADMGVIVTGLIAL